MILLHPKIHLMPPPNALRTPDALEGQGLPTGSATIGNRARTALSGGRQGVHRAVLTFEISAVIVVARRQFPVEQAFGIALYGQAMHGVGRRLIG